MFDDGYLLPFHFQMPFYGSCYVQTCLRLGLVLGLLWVKFDYILLDSVKLKVVLTTLTSGVYKSIFMLR